MPRAKSSGQSKSKEGQLEDFADQFVLPSGRAFILGVIQVAPEGLILADARDVVVKMLKSRGIKDADMIFGGSYDRFDVRGGGKVSVWPLQPLERWIHVIVDSIQAKDVAS